LPTVKITIKPPVDIASLPNGKHPVTGVPGLRCIVRGGSRIWEFRYTMPGETQDRYFPLGAFSTAFGLSRAISARHAAAELVKNNKCPKQERENEESVARLVRLKTAAMPTYRQYVLGLKADLPKNPRSHAAAIRYGVNILGKVADLKPHEITTEDLAEALRPHWHKRGTIIEATKYISRFLRLAREDRKITDPHWANPSSLKTLRRMVGELAEKRHRKAISIEELPALLAALRRGRNDCGDPLTFLIVELIILSALRSTEVSRLRWTYVDRERNILAIPRAEMKGDMKGADKSVTHFEVPLTPQMIRVLDRARFLAPPKTDDAPIFPSLTSEKDEFFDDGTILDVLTTLGFRDEDAPAGDRSTIHGFRTLFTDWARAQTRAQVGDDGKPLVIDGEEMTDFRWSKSLVLMCIAHVEKDESDRAYARTMPSAPRRGVMSAWSLFCDPVASNDDLPLARPADVYAPARKRGRRRL
jgi:integrase